MSWWVRLGVIAVQLAVLAGIGAAVRSHFIDQGDAQGAQRIQGAWDAQKAVDQAESTRLALQASAEQATKFRNAERIADEQARRERATQRRVVAADAAVVSLRSTIDALNRSDLPQGGDACAVARSEQAATARELLGRCSERYRDVAAAADGLRDQVAGLLDDAQTVCRSSKPTVTTP